MRLSEVALISARKGKPGVGIGTTDPAPPKVPSRKGTSSVGQSTIRFLDLPHLGEAIGWKTMREERNLMLKRITLLIAALTMALTMALGAAGAAFADPDCGQVPNNNNCVTTVEGPGGSEDSQGQAQEKNKNVETETTFKGRPQ